MPYQTIKIFFILINILAIAACGGGGSSDNPPADEVPAVSLQEQTINFSETGTIELQVGDVRTTTTSAKSEGALNFHSADTDIVNIDANGTISAMSAGATRITITAPADQAYKSASLELAVVVSKRPANTRFEVDRLTLMAGVNHQIAAFTDSDAGLEFSSANPEIATVSTTGWIDTKAQGLTTIIAKSKESARFLAGETTLALTVGLAPQSLSLALGTSPTGFIGEQLTNTASSPGTGSFSFTSSDPTIASIDDSGVLSLLTAGQADITVSRAADTLYASAETNYRVTVLKLPATLSFAYSGSLTKLVDETLVNPAISSTGSSLISYSVSDPSRATISEDGAVTLLEAGTLVITAYQAASTNYQAAAASYSIDVNRHPQSLIFEHSGDQTLLVDDLFTNIASGGPGIGAITYESDDSDIVYVDDEGDIYAFGAGTTTIHAAKAADRKYAAATANYSVTVERHPQTISFADATPLKTLVGHALTPSLTEGDGTGEISFSSSDTAVATVNDDGEISVLTSGHATITATKEADEKYAAASAIIDLHAVPRKISLTAWVGADKSQVEFNEGATGVEWAASNTSDCDMDDTIACTNGSKQDIGHFPTDEYSFKGAQTSYYQYRHGNFTASMPLQVARWRARTGTKVAQLNGYLYLMGGSDSPYGNYIDVWRSENGVQFTRINKYNGSTGSRIDHSVIGFNNKLWLLGGTTSDASIWSSADGTSWTKEVINAPFDKRSRAQMIVKDGLLYLIGGNDPEGNTLKDVWRSADGISWSSIATDQAFPKEAHAVLFNGKIWLVGGDGGDGSGRVLSSNDGISWNVENAAPPFSALSGKGGAAVFDNKIWLVEGASEHTWFSADGVNWQAGAPLPVASITNAAIHSFNNQLLIFAGSPSNETAISEHIYAYLGDSWGIVSDRHIGKPHEATIVAGGNALWVLTQNEDINKRQMLSSEDGKQWSELHAPPGTNQGGNFVYFNNALWLIQTDHDDGKRSHYYDQNEGWVSVDHKPEFSARTYAQTLVHDNRIWLMGGNNTGSGDDPNDIWTSSDGVTWTLVGSNELLSRNNYTTASFNGKLWVTGGQSFDDGTHYYHKDIHSSVDGITWVKEADNVPYGHRTHSELFAQNDRLWIIGGWSNEGFKHYQDVWSSADGKTWQRELWSTNLGPTLLPSIAVLNGTAYLSRGNGYNDARPYGFWRSLNGYDWDRLILQDAYLK
ncbi:Ig-like domain-containing protein [Simiduia aestuariiviva]|uniref:Putative small lipoprotein YifL n=1 Tax=Simiduia aestuariiviva TaxID=1510459 RepID=A0A839UFX6_9GAMM|nr:Ig-like domain-containing protein [Simiduia aestuariiviva]MBB3166944.1 putative small lipoprotein YifL [Simiduia aestuariiviva]